MTQMFKIYIKNKKSKMSKNDKNVKNNRKKLQYFTLTNTVSEIFDNYLKSNFIDKSKLIESFVIQYLKDKKINIEL